MIHKLRALAPTLIAVFAMGSIAVSTASATVQVHSEGAPITLTGSQEGGSHALDIQFGEVKCTTAKYSATITITTVTTVTVTPTYEGCTFAGVATIVDMNGCDYLLHINNEGPPYKGLGDIACPASKEITITGGTKCTVHIPEQTGLGPITVTNLGIGATREVTANVNAVDSIAYSQTPGTGIGKCASVTTSAGKLTGTGTVTGETDPGATHTGIWIE